MAQQKTKKVWTPVSAEAFIEAWQGSDSVHQVVEKLGMSATAVNARAFHYRKKMNLPLKRFSRGRVRLNAEALRALAEKLNKVT